MKIFMKHTSLVEHSVSLTSTSLHIGSLFAMSVSMPSSFQVDLTPNVAHLSFVFALMLCAHIQQT